MFSSFVLDSDFGFKYFLEIIGTKITLWFWIILEMIIMVKSGDQANSVANKSEYIREGYALK